MANLTLVIGDIVKNNRFEHIEVLHSTDCRDLVKLKSGINRNNVSCLEYNTIEEARSEYEIDVEEMGYYFDAEVKILPCVHNH
jgi:hypothetical protein